MVMRELRYQGPGDWPAIGSWLAGRECPSPEVEARVRDILARVAQAGDEAVAELTRQFDCPGFETASLQVDPAEILAARELVAPEDLAIIQEAAGNIRRYHEAQAERSWWQPCQGAILGQMVTPVSRVGLYVPGGQGGETPLISSILMNAIPAQVAGVDQIVMASPPRQDGSLNPYILATADLLGITRILRMGSAWAIAALALGTQSIEPVDVIAGPGNIYVTTAKRLLVGKVGIDMIAGPSEIAVLADDTGNPEFIAADMLSQAEHDPLASTLLITPSRELAQAVGQALDTQLSRLPRSSIAAKALDDWSAAIIVPDLAAGFDLVNRVAPEHLELALADPWAALPHIRNAGAIFLGHHCPEPVGDYFAGPNHVLPTFGTARFSSALSVATFLKRSSVIAVDRDYVLTHGSKIARLARLEGLEAHARSVEVRLERQGK